MPHSPESAAADMLSRRRFLHLLGLGAATTLAAACQSAAPTPAAAPTAAAQAANTAVAVAPTAAAAAKPAATAVAAIAPTVAAAAKPAATAVAQVAPTVAAAAPTAAAAASSADAMRRWDELVAAAKQEGKVVLKGPPTADVRTGLPRVFKEKFGIEMEYVGGPSSQGVTQLRNERAANIFSTDVILSGADSMYTGFYAEKMLDPLRPVLIHTDAVDASKWPEGKLRFMDPGQDTVLRLNNYMSPILAANTSIVKPEEIKSWYDLLKPQYTGKLASFDPTGSGSGVGTATYLATKLGEDYVRKLFLEQKTTFSGDHRQLADWLARGTYPIVLSLRDIEQKKVAEDGFPVANIPHPPEAPGYITAGFGLLGIANQAPHPNAARLLVNWLAMKEGMETWSKLQNIVPIRLDADKSQWTAEVIPEPGKDYLDTYDWNYVINERQPMIKKMQAMLKR